MSLWGGEGVGASEKCDSRRTPLMSLTENYCRHQCQFTGVQKKSSPDNYLGYFVRLVKSLLDQPTKGNCWKLVYSPLPVGGNVCVDTQRKLHVAESNGDWRLWKVTRKD